MRKVSLAIAAATLTLPVAMPAPAFAAQDGYYQGKTWRDSQGRTRCRKRNGTVGLIVGGAAGALAGRAIDTRGNRTTGTVLGAAAGALLGREVQKSRGFRCR
jgi:hypothetical protein